MREKQKLPSVKPNKVRNQANAVPAEHEQFGVINHHEAMDSNTMAESNQGTMLINSSQSTDMPLYNRQFDLPLSINLDSVMDIPQRIFLPREPCSSNSTNIHYDATMEVDPQEQSDVHFDSIMEVDPQEQSDVHFLGEEPCFEYSESISMEQQEAPCSSNSVYAKKRTSTSLKGRNNDFPTQLDSSTANLESLNIRNPLSGTKRRYCFTDIDEEREDRKRKFMEERICTVNSPTKSTNSVAPITAYENPINSVAPIIAQPLYICDSDHDYIGNGSATNASDTIQQNPLRMGQNQRVRMTKAQHEAFRRYEEKREKYWLKGFQHEDVEFYRLGKLKYSCKFCGAQFFRQEESGRKKYWNAEKDDYEYSYAACCKHGKLQETMSKFIGNFPAELQHFFTPGTKQYRHFMDFIRKINSSFSLASLQCCKFEFPTPGAYCFRVQGMLLHKFNIQGLPAKNEFATNGQLYFLDINESKEIRKSEIKYPDILLPHLDQFEKYLRENNPFAESYKMMKDVYQELETKYANTGISMPEVKIVFERGANFDRKKYNIPTANEVCAIIITDANGDVPPARIVVHATAGPKRLRNLYPLDPMVEPMMYPLFYPNGNFGWSYKLQDSNGDKITLCDFIKYLLFTRANIFSPQHHGGKLFQQWTVDMYARVEWDRTQYINRNQKEIAKTTPKSLKDYLVKTSKEKEAVVVRQVILPSSFVGSPRCMHEHFMDAMTVVSATGNPDYFITFTCSPSDPDITENLYPQQSSNMRSEMVARVFHLKKQQMLDEITGGLFGKMISKIMVIEYQCRGLPHMHAIFTMAPDHKLFDVDQIDQLIQAQIPDKNRDPELYDLVTKYMLHGPCKQGSPCWNAKKLKNKKDNDENNKDENQKNQNKKEGKCDKHFPKAFCEKTELTENGYTKYARPDNGRFVYRKGVPLTNQYVVPYSPYLLKRFQSHINMERVADIKAIKYLYKYLYKGYDEATLVCYEIGENGEQKVLKYDEVAKYLHARYLSPVEACWRLFKFPLQSKSHSIVHLQIHLEDEQPIFMDTDASEETMQQAVNRNSTLTAYFEFLQKHPDFECLYIDMPTKCVWDKTKRKWKFREKQDKTLGRMYHVDPRNSELYHFRLLLLNFCERSFKAYLTWEGITYATYVEAARARGLCKNDEEYKLCMQEASFYRFPRGLRILFATILVHCSPSSPRALWEEFKDDMSEDISYACPRTPKDSIYAKALYLIDKHLKDMGKQLSDFKMLPDKMEPYLETQNDETVNESVEQALADAFYNKMNNGQKEILETLREAFAGDKTMLAFIDGPGGTGKSFTLLALYHLGRANGKKICNMAFSGIAATVLKAGQTLHKRFDLPLDIGPNSASRIPNQGKEFEELKEIDIFIWDEAPMASKWILEVIDKKLREIMQSNKPFGGKTLILAGDFRQCLTMKEHATRTEIIDMLLKKSKLWEHFKQLELTENMRANPIEKEFAAQLLAIGDGIANDDEDYIKLPDECKVVDENTSLVDEIYGDIMRDGNFSELSNRAILSPYNAVVQRYNNEVLENFPGKSRTFHSIDDSDPGSMMQMPPEILNTLTVPSFPEHKLTVKPECALMLLRNLNVKEGLCNGTRLRLKEAGNNILRCEIITGDKKGQEVYIPRITLIETKKTPIPLERHQFPLRLAFAFTINKSQSQTFERIAIDYKDPPFAHGQTYVALSRVRSWSGVRVRLPDADVEHRRMRNIVWKEALV